VWVKIEKTQLQEAIDSQRSRLERKKGKKRVTGRGSSVRSSLPTSLELGDGSGTVSADYWRKAWGEGLVGRTFFISRDGEEGVPIPRWGKCQEGRLLVKKKFKSGARSQPGAFQPARKKISEGKTPVSSPKLIRFQRKKGRRKQTKEWKSSLTFRESI